MSSQDQELTLPSEIEVPIHYMVDTGETPVFHQTASAADRVTLRGNREAHAMTIRNARLLANDFSLDAEGFAFAEHVTKVTDFYDDAQLTSVYKPEIEKLIARLTGAREVVVFDHTRRSSDGAHREEHNWRDRCLCRTAITRTSRRRSGCATSFPTTQTPGSPGALPS